jgi:hypothetical protein
MSSLPRRIRQRTALELDLRRFERRHGRVLRARTPPPRGVLLVASLTQSVYQLKLEGMLAKALELHGLEPVFVVAEESALARRYLRVFGFERFVELNAYLAEEERDGATETAAALLGDVNTIRGVKEISFRGVAVGVQALATVSRILHEGAVSLDTPETRRLLLDLLALAIRATLAAERLLDELEPQVFLFNERNYALEAPLSDVALARGVNVVQFVSAFQDDAFVFKRYTHETRRLHPRSLSDESWQKVCSVVWTPERDAELDDDLRRRYGNEWSLTRRIQAWTHEEAPERILARLGLDPAKRTAVVFSHVLWDANMFYGDDLFDDQEHWFVETVKAACANDRVNWIVKLHPANVWKLVRDGYEGELGELVALREAVGEVPPHVAVLLPDSDIATSSIFALADWGITIRGSVGIELPCLGVPVLTAGTGYYAGRGFTIDSDSVEEYLGRLRTIDSIVPLSPEEIERARRYAYALFRLRPTRFTTFRSTFKPPARAADPLDQNIELTIGSAEELEAARDLRSFAEWAFGSRAADYLELPEENAR